MVNEGRKKHDKVSIPQPPRKINAQKLAESRAPELKALHSIICTRLDNDFRSCRNKRRRTTAFDDQVSRKGKKRSRSRYNPKVAEFSENEHTKKTSRRIRRSRELRQNPDTGFCLSGDGTKRLRTHVWHAKRFTMTKLWGFYLPLGLQGRGKGSRALLKKLTEGVLVHDASYDNAIQLEAPEDSLVSILNAVLMPSPSEHVKSTSESILSGLAYGSAMLCQAGFSHCISPVIYAWRPLCHKETVNVRSETTMDATTKSNGDDVFQVNGDEKLTCKLRQFWLWIHPSAFEEGFAALQCACQKEMEERNISISCHSLEGELGKLEIVGSGALQLLQKVLHPVSSMSMDEQLRKCNFLEKDTDSGHSPSSVLKEMDHISCSIISLNVEDPRQLQTRPIQQSTSSHASDNLVEVEVLDPAAVSSLQFSSEVEQISSLNAQNGLWDPTKRLIPPVEENIICMEKHQQRMGLFCVDEANPQKSDSSIQTRCSRSCPLLLLKNNSKKNENIGFSVILPLNWVRAFWISLVYNGAQAIGLREKHWIACDMGLPFFPSDFPDCSAYSRFVATFNSTSTKKIQLRPPSAKPSRVPFPPPWHCIRTSLTEELFSGGNPLPPTTDYTVASNLSTNDGGSFDVSSNGGNYSLFDGIVARTGRTLLNFLDELHIDPVLLFPQGMDKKMKDNKKFVLDKRKAFLNIYDRKFCFVRVCVRACKEGFFEEGAVICAPHPSDMLSWTSSLDKNESVLRISQSAVDSYFKVQSPSRWEVQMPEDLIDRDSHRWPIGFVTTGFVRGSKKLMAEGFCEAVLLAHLREKQWQDVWRRKEIHVLVRNLRSTAYRMALATIVLEHQEDDLEFM